jgi:hypothetical protein
MTTTTKRAAKTGKPSRASGGVRAQVTIASSGPEAPLEEGPGLFYCLMEAEVKNDPIVAVA